MVILYSGIGCNEKKVHSEIEFLQIMEREFTNKHWEQIINKTPPGYIHYQLDFNGLDLPHEFKFFTLDDWIDYSGAVKEFDATSRL